MERVIGSFDSGDRNVLMVVVGAIHGNELAGVKAINNVFREIEQSQLKVKGKILGIAGNLSAIEEKKRYLDYDLNRCWTFDKINAVRSTPKADLNNEDLELIELLGILDEFSEGEYEQKVLVDLHTTSAENGNFIVIPGNPSEQSIVRSLKLPMIIDLDRYVHGTLLQHMHQRGFLSFAFEGGQIGSEKAIDLHTHGIWELLYQAGAIEPKNDFKKLLHYEELVGSLHAHLPTTVKVLHRHKIERQDYFRMKPGYQNFQRINKGEILAEDKKGIITSLFDGMIFMPLYQNIGNDGFFIVEEL